MKSAGQDRTVGFRLLGEVGVLVDGIPVDAGHIRQRAVLAALLVDVNRPVSADQLIDRVWAGAPPYRARNALSAYVSRAPSAPAALHAGRHSDLLAELATDTQQHPLDERLAGQLMLALFRSGRQADASDVYRRMRARLRDELGADPGPQLRRVHQEILAGAGPPPRRDPVRATGNLQRRVTSFVGREADVALIIDALRDGPLVTLTGVGGVGESRLAVEAASREQGRFADGGWLCELAPLPDDGPVSVAVALRVQQRHGLTIDQSVIEYLRSRELLLVLDNCEHVLDPVARLLEQVVQHCPKVVVLATSREPLGVDGARIRPLDPQPAEDSAALFVDRARAGRPDFEPDSDEAGAVTEICRQLDGLPLAIELAAARMRMMNAAEVARRLDSGRALGRGPRGGAAAPPEPRRDRRVVLPPALHRRAGAVRAAVGVRRRVRPRRGGRGLCQPRRRDGRAAQRPRRQSPW